MSRANSFGGLDDFGSDISLKPVLAKTIEKIAESSGFLGGEEGGGVVREISGETGETPSTSPARKQRRHVTGRNRQINIKATEKTITELYRIADAMNLPLGAVLEQALAALDKQRSELYTG